MAGIGSDASYGSGPRRSGGSGGSGDLLGSIGSALGSIDLQGISKSVGDSIGGLAENPKVGEVGSALSDGYVHKCNLLFSVFYFLFPISTNIMYIYIYIYIYII